LGRLRHHISISVNQIADHTRPNQRKKNGLWEEAAKLLELVGREGWLPQQENQVCRQFNL
jgi:hypothetical protein